MDIVIIVLLTLVFISLVFLIIKSKISKDSNIDLLSFSNSLNSQIQEIRKEIDKNSRDSRNEVEIKLNKINQQIND